MGCRRLALFAAIGVLTAAVVGGAPPTLAARAALVASPAPLVNTLVMTTGGGNDFPGADVPFGMVQWSPDTSPSRPDGGGYDFTNSQIRGFSLTHMAGPGCGAMGDLPILPMTGPLPSGDPGVHMEPFTHTGEQATAGSYSVSSGSPAIKTELTATLHSGMGRFTFPATTQADVLIKLLDSQNGTSASSAQIVGSNEVTGAATSGHFCGAAETYTVHFDITFDRPFTASRIVDEGQAPGPNSVFLTFDTSSNRVVQAKVGISFVSAANAKANWQADNAGFDFASTQAAAVAAWNGALGRIQVAGGTAAQQQLFYTSLYHVLLHPNVVSDANGQYIGFDNQVHAVATGHAQYDNFSGWDVFHGQTQLSALVAPAQTSDIAQSLLNDAAQGSIHLMPQWGFENSYNYVMVGDPAQAALADYYAFGARGFDTTTALNVMKTQATTTNDVRPETALENKHGFIPNDGSYPCCNAHGFLSSQLEYDQADFALSRFAQTMGDTATASSMLTRANNWKNVFNPANQLLNPRNANGQFVGGITPTSTNSYVEGTAAQYRFVVPFNQAALAGLLGGNAKVVPMLDSFFTTLDGSNGNNAFLANEFDLGTPWFYNWVGAPSHTMQLLSRIESQLYQDTPSGFPNNDDLGTMSANYVWGALGFYPVTPGTADLVFNSPMFTQAVIQLPGGGTMTVNAPQASGSNIYVQSLKVDGAVSTRSWLPASSWQNGVTLDFTLGSAASSWGTAAADAPPSYDTPPPFDNAGISADASPAAADYDGNGFSYSADALAAANVKPGGTVSAGGLTFTWPNVAAGQPDNFQAMGQTIAVNGTPGAPHLGLLGSASNVGSGGSSGTLVVRFSDGTTQSVTMTLSDWTLGAGSFTPVAGNVTAVTTPYRNSTSGTRQTVNTMVFAVNTTLPAGKTVASVTLPFSVNAGQFHVFALATG
jgi:predicted alpha-1,2-mannosidase